MTQNKDSWWRPVALLMLVIAIAMDLLVWHLSGGAQLSAIFEQMVHGFVLAFGGTSFALLIVSLGSVHRHAHSKEQISGLLLLAGLGFSLSFTQYGSIEEMRQGGVILLSGLTGMLTALGLVFGLLLALVTGREHTTDPLLDMESTDGDVSIELEG